MESESDIHKERQKINVGKEDILDRKLPFFWQPSSGRKLAFANID
jgi:hypothetical protein